MMRVLFFNEGNLGTHVLGHAQLDSALRVGLAQAPDVEAHFAHLRPMGRWPNAAVNRALEPLGRANLDLHELRWHVVQSLRARKALRHELQAWPADVVHVYSHAIAFALTGMMRRLPIVLATDTAVVDWWDMPAWHRRQRYALATIAGSRLLERRALRRAPLVLARTAWTRRGLEREQPAANVAEHHPGIDLERYRPAPRRTRARPRILFVGGRFVEKGGEDLLAAVGDSLGHDFDLELVTPADVPGRPGLQVHRLAPGDPRLLDLQQQADVLCLPTYADTNPWTILEAMACGTPVVTTGVGGIPDMLDGGRAGVIVPVGDRRALAESLRALLADSARRGELAAVARRRCEERYDARQQFALLVGHLRAVSRGVRSGAAGKDEPVETSEPGSLV